MDPAKTAAIDIVEAGYDLELEPSDWLPNVSVAGRPLFDLGLGYYVALLGGKSEDGQHLITQLHQGAGPDDLLPRIFRAAQVAGAESVARWSQAMMTKGVGTVSELKDEFPQAHKALTEHGGYKDGLSLNAIDPDWVGVSVTMPSPELIELSPRERERWLMLAIHIAAGHRLRRGIIDSTGASGVTSTEMPIGSEALLDPNKFVVSQAAGGAQDRAASEVIREAAIRIDRARGKLRKSDPEEALEIWHGLVRGRWSLIDWFDTDGRRFVLAKPNAPSLGDPRGLTERELQVATYAARGESGKIIGYRFGISPQRVSTLLSSTMRKLSVKTQAQLVERMRGLPSEPLEQPDS
jgi:DNA-binding CsgD family transcriptional regulator